MFCASYVYLFNLCWTGFTSPQPIVGRVYPSTLAFYPSKGRVDGSLDEAVTVVTFMHVRQRIYDTWQVAHIRSRLVFRESMRRSAMVSVLPPGIDLRKLQRSHSRVDRYPVY